MGYIDYDTLEGLDPHAYRSQTPYPWANPQGILTPQGFDALRRNLPDISNFTQSFGVARRAGQKPHDRYTLEYERTTPLDGPWKEFIHELTGQRYRSALCRLLDVPKLDLNFHWHYTPTGCSVSPHCDAPLKLGSHIFYFNTEEDWQPDWGGETVVLDDGGRFSKNAAPDFADFDRALPSETLGNRSFIFSRRGNSWHGVREVNCPEGSLRKVFIVVLNRADIAGRIRAQFSRRQFQRF